MKRVGSLVLLSLLVASVAASRVRTGTLSGTVIGPDGAAVAGARVMVQQSDGRHPRAKLTDAEGRFTFRLLAVGPYDVRAYSKGAWSEWQRQVIVRPGKPTKIEIHQPAAQDQKK